MSKTKQHSKSNIHHSVEIEVQPIPVIIDNRQPTNSTELRNEHPPSNTNKPKSGDIQNNLLSDQSSLKSNVIVDGNRDVTIHIQKNMIPSPPLIHHHTSTNLEGEKPPIRKHLEKRVDVEQNASQIRNLTSKYFYSTYKI